MTKSLKLIKPTIEMEYEYFDYINEWLKAEEEIVPSTFRYFPKDYHKFLEKLRRDGKVEQPDGRVPATTYILVQDSGRWLGACNIRHELNDVLLSIGGHVGYGVRPSERGKGYATEILRLSLLQLEKVGVTRALITCNADNVASEKVIINNGGKEDKSFTEEDGNIVKRFWIDIKSY
ncbi:GNAT family N-acetyltransferase [Bacillaceae bacterium W0354]